MVRREGLSLDPDPNSPFLGPVLVGAQLRLPTHPQGQLLRPPGLSAHQQEGIQLRTGTASLRSLFPKAILPGRLPIDLADYLERCCSSSISVHISRNAFNCRSTAMVSEAPLCRRAKPATNLVLATGHTSCSAS